MISTIENFIARWENAIDKKLCEDIIEYFNFMKSSGFSQSRQQTSARSKLLQDTDSILVTADTIKFANPDLHKPIVDSLWNVFFPEYMQRYAALHNVENFYICEMKIQKTGIGQGYHEWHFETDTVATSKRIFNYHLYLNDVDEGGETEFLYYGQREKPTAGTVLIYPGYFTHTHRGNPPISNGKYLVNGWIEL